MTQIKSPNEVTQLLNSSDEEERREGYQAFLGRTHWLGGNTPADLCQLACKQLQLSAGDVFVYPPRSVQPAILWASQGNLEADKLGMVEAAYHYIFSIGEEFPPIVVWNFYESQRIRMIIHDGHHRAWFFHQLKNKINAVVMEPSADYAKAESRFRLAFRMRKLAIDLPVL